MVIENQWLKVRADDCITSEGFEISPYYVFEYPDWVQIVALDSSDHIILVEQYRHGLGVLSLELPAGSVEPGDGSPIRAGARELAEETGYVADRWHLVASLSPNPANHNNHLHVLLAQGAVSCGDPDNNPSERLRTIRMPLNEAIHAAMDGKIIQALHVGSLALVLMRLGRWIR